MGKLLQDIAELALGHQIDLVDVNVFLKDMNDFAKYNQVYSKHFSFDNPPARTTVAVADLPGNNFIEIKAIACLSSNEE